MFALSRISCVQYLIGHNSKIWVIRLAIQCAESHLILFESFLLICIALHWMNKSNGQYDCKHILKEPTETSFPECFSNEFVCFSFFLSFSVGHRNRTERAVILVGFGLFWPRQFNYLLFKTTTACFHTMVVVVIFLFQLFATIVYQVNQMRFFFFAVALFARNNSVRFVFGP